MAPEPPARILLADDDLDLLDATAYVLRREGFNVVTATDGETALRRWRAVQPDLTLLDVRMPRLGGLEVCRRIRRSSQAPIVLLTAADDEEHVLQGFRSGADDYVTKPFRPRELASRIRAVLRRHAGQAAAGAPAGILAAGLRLEPATHQVVVGSATVHLTPREFQILSLLATHEGKVVGFGRLLESGWGYDNGEPSLLKSHVSHLRKKLGQLPGWEGQIDVIRGAGYILRVRAGQPASANGRRNHTTPERASQETIA